MKNKKKKTTLKSKHFISKQKVLNCNLERRLYFEEQN